MLPVIGPHGVIAVDMHVTEIARLQRLPSADILVSANHKYVPIDITKDPKWKISGQVLWWVSKDL